MPHLCCMAKNVSTANKTVMEDTVKLYTAYTTYEMLVDNRT